MQQRDHKAMGTRNTRLTRKIKAVAYDGRPPFFVNKRRKPCYLSQTAGLHRFLILYKDYNTAAFFTGSGFSGAKIRRKTEKFGENQRKTEKFRENQRKSEKNQRKFRENQRKIRENTEKFREKWRKM